VYNATRIQIETGSDPASRLYVVAAGIRLGLSGVSAIFRGQCARPAFSGNLSGGNRARIFKRGHFPQNGRPVLHIQSSGTGYAHGHRLQLSATRERLTAHSAAVPHFPRRTQVRPARREPAIESPEHYSFEYGGAHFLFLDAQSPSLHNNLPGGMHSVRHPDFVPYPTALGQWVITDLYIHMQPCKIVRPSIKPPFTSGDATIANARMRANRQPLEDHGANPVFRRHDTITSAHCPPRNREDLGPGDHHADRLRCMRTRFRLHS